MTIKAFDAEIATICHSTKTPEAAAIRYEFWRSALNRVKAGRDFEGHPLAEDLFKAKLTEKQMGWLEESLETRAVSLDRRIYTFADLDNYANKSLVKILLCLNSISNDFDISLKDTEHALEHLGKAQITLRRLNGLAKALSKGNPLAEQFVPIGLLGKTGLNGPKMIELLKLSDEKKIRDLVHEMASHAHSHLSLTENMNVFIKLSKYCSDRYLDKLEKCNFNILNSKIQRIGGHRDGLLPIKLYFKTLF